MSFGEKRFSYRLRVGYVDTDRGGVVHHSAYLRYLEAARIEFLRHYGVSYKEFEIDQELALPVVEASLRYRRPAFFDDELTVEVWVGLITKARVRFDSKVMRDQELLSEAQITLACVQVTKGRPTSIPASILSACSDPTTPLI